MEKKYGFFLKSIFLTILAAISSTAALAGDGTYSPPPSALNSPWQIQLVVDCSSSIPVARVHGGAANMFVNSNPTLGNGSSSPSDMERFLDILAVNSYEARSSMLQINSNN